MSRTRKTAKQTGKRRVILVPASEVKTCKPEGNKTNTITFRVDGIPATQGSKKHVGRGVMVEMNKKLPAWRKDIINTGRAVAPKTPLDCPVSVETTIWVPRPKKPRFNVPATPGDLDKYLRAIGDGIEQAGILKNDARITHWTATKHYANEATPPGADITITWKETQ